jgi:predicted nucleic acid-binding protein
MAFLLDTSVLVRQADQYSSQHPIALQALTRLQDQGHSLCIFPQCLVEFWAIATRPLSANGLGLSVLDADVERARLERVFTLLPDTPYLYERWVQVVNQFGVSGKPTHDARLVAAMLEQNLAQVLTFNTSDFLRYAPVGIVAIDPANV